MQLLLNEIRKILNWKIIILLLLVNVVLYFFLIEFNINYFPNGRPGLDYYNVGVEMKEKYGKEMDEIEFEDFKSTYDEQLKKGDQFVQSREEFINADLHTFDEFKRSEMNFPIFNQEEDVITLFMELQTRHTMIEFYENMDKRFDFNLGTPNQSQTNRINEVKEGGHYRSVMPEGVIENYKSIISGIAVIIIISLVLVVSPLFIKDRSRQMLDLQYTSKKGRHLYKTKLAAGFISAFFVMTSLLVVYLYINSKNNTAMFFDVPIHTPLLTFYWYDLTLLQYIILTVVAVYLLGFIFTMLAMSISTIAPTFIVLLGIQIPIIIAMIAYGRKLLLDRIVDLWLPKWFVPTSYCVLVGVGIIVIMLMWRREKKKDIVA